MPSKLSKILLKLKVLLSPKRRTTSRTGFRDQPIIMTAPPRLPFKDVQAIDKRSTFCQSLNDEAISDIANFLAFAEGSGVALDPVLEDDELAFENFIDASRFKQKQPTDHLKQFKGTELHALAEYYEAPSSPISSYFDQSLFEPQIMVNPKRKSMMIQRTTSAPWLPPQRVPRGLTMANYRSM